MHTEFIWSCTNPSHRSFVIAVHHVCKSVPTQRVSTVTQLDQAWPPTHTLTFSPSCFCFPSASSAPPPSLSNWLLTFSRAFLSTWLLPLLPPPQSADTGTKVQQGGFPGDASLNTTCSVNRPQAWDQQAETSGSRSSSLTDGWVHTRSLSGKLKLNAPS